MQGRQHEAFTLLEVMVAVAILAVAMSAIFSSQVGAVRLGMRAAHTDTATLLARCKMGEIEERVLVDGLPAIEAGDTDGCCEGAEIEGYQCEWLIERVVLPSINLEEGAGDEAFDDGESASPSASDTTGGMGVADAMDSVMTGQIDALVMDFTYPIMKPIIEEQVRRATVRVFWREGQREHDFEVAQFLVSEQPASASDDEETGAEEDE